MPILPLRPVLRAVLRLPVRGRAVSLALAAVLLGLGGPGAQGQAHPSGVPRALTVDDVLRMADVGRAVLTPDGRTLVYEWIASYEQAPNVEAFATGRSALAKLYTLDLAQPGAAAPRPLFEQAARGGYWLGGLSPDGSRVDVYSLVDGVVKAGVFEFASRRLIWFDFTPNYDLRVKWPVWLSAEELVYSVRPPDQQPLFRPALVARLNELWQKAFDGREPTATVLQSTPSGIAEADSFRPGALVRVNARTGATVTLGDGHFYNLRLAPGGRYLAALKEGGFIQPNARAVATFRRLQLVVFDLRAGPGGTGAERVPCPTCDISIASLEWSGDGERLVFAARPLGAELGADESFEYAVGTAVLSRAKPRDDQEERGLVLLGLGQSIGITKDARFVVEDGEVWRVGTDGRRRNLTARVKAPVSAWHRGVEWVDWTGFTPLPAAYGVVQTPDQVLRLNLERGDYVVIPKPAPDAQLLAVADTAPSAVFQRVTRGGASALVVASKRGPARTVLTFNQDLADVTPARQVQLSYAVQDTTLSSCALLPPDWVPGKRSPLIVYIYPHNRGRCVSTHIASFNPSTEELLAARGYIVLFAANPERLTRTPEGPDRRLTPVVLAAVDEAVRVGYADPERLGVYGISQGHHSVLLLLTGTTRFRAAVAAYGISDFISQYGTRNLYTRISLDDFYPMGNTDRFELTRTTNALGAKPWDDPMRYVRNSALFAADKIETPLLLIHSDFDQFPQGQSEEIFTALYRLRKEASYVIYWGESHGNSSPANIRDMWQRIFAWFDEHLASRGTSKE